MPDPAATASTPRYCPIQLMYQLNGIYYYSASTCVPPYMLAYITSTVPLQTGCNSPDCTGGSGLLANNASGVQGLSKGDVSQGIADRLDCTLSKEILEKYILMPRTRLIAGPENYLLDYEKTTYRIRAFRIQTQFEVPKDDGKPENLSFVFGFGQETTPGDAARILTVVPEHANERALLARYEEDGKVQDFQVILKKW